MGIRYNAEATAIEIREMIDRRREDQEWYRQRMEGDGEGITEEKRRGLERRVAMIQKDIVTLQAVLRRLELTNDIEMNFIAEDVMERILAVRKQRNADRYVGLLVYYELKPRWQWDEEGRNMVACVGNVKDWPFGEYNMTDMGDGTFKVTSDHPGPFCWVLDGRFVPVSIENEEREEAEA